MTFKVSPAHQTLVPFQREARLQSAYPLVRRQRWCAIQGSNPMPAALRTAMQAGEALRARCDLYAKRRLRYALPKPFLSCFSRNRAFNSERHAS
jgi:hypothetical protein